MRLEDGWFWPDREHHMNAWVANPKNRMIINGRPAYQGKKQTALIDLCANFRTAIDVGSHIGMWTYNLAVAFDVVRCFEPMAEHRSCFARNVEAENVILYPLALGDRSAMVGMKTNETSTGDTYVQGDGDTQMEMLDSFEFQGVDCIKIDAEGFEENILRGGVETIKRCRPVICVEQKRDMACKFGLEPLGAVRFLESLGYVVVREIGGDYLLSMPEAPDAA
jgi:FkbM family methyltransferase